MIYKCLALFNLLPTSQPHLWLIAADWLEEEGLDITAIAFRENVFVLGIVNFKTNGIDGDGNGNGNGRGRGKCSGESNHGSGYGLSYGGYGGYGLGYGDGGGLGNGNGCGF